MNTRPAASEGRYIPLVPEDDVISALAKQEGETDALLRSIGEQKAAFRYAPEKWSIKMLVGHFVGLLTPVTVIDARDAVVAWIR